MAESPETLPSSDVILMPNDLDEARLYWIKDSQFHLQEEDKRFPTWRRQLDLFVDGDGVWRWGVEMWR